MTDWKAFQDILTRVNEEHQNRSQAIATEVRDQLAPMVASGDVLLGIDHAYSRQFLTGLHGGAVLATTGVDLSIPIAVMKLCLLLEPVLVLTFAILSFVAFGWWGLISLPSVPLIFLWGSWSNLTGNGEFSYLMVIAFGVYAIAADSAAVSWWALAAAAIGVVQRAMYAIPKRACRRAALISPRFLDAAITANVAVLERPTSR